MADFVSLEKVDRVAVVTIDNPPLNVLSKPVTQQLGETFAKIAQDRDVIVALLTGTGQKAFMAGADITEFPESIGKPGMKEKILETHRVFNQIERMPKPVIAVLNGITFGGGCELALACDLRIAEAHAQIGLPEIKLGLFPGGGGTQRLPRLIGEAKAKELMFLGEPIDANEAEKIGLVNKVVSSGDGLSAALKAANKMSSYSLQALSRIKAAVNQGLDLTIDQGLDVEADLFDEVFQTKDVEEGVRAFIEKRKPSFTHE